MDNELKIMPIESKSFDITGTFQVLDENGNKTEKTETIFGYICVNWTPRQIGVYGDFCDLTFHHPQFENFEDAVAWLGRSTGLSVDYVMSKTDSIRKNMDRYYDFAIEDAVEYVVENIVNAAANHIEDFTAGKKLKSSYIDLFYEEFSRKTNAISKKIVSTYSSSNHLGSMPNLPLEGLMQHIVALAIFAKYGGKDFRRDFESLDDDAIKDSIASFLVNEGVGDLNEETGKRTLNEDTKNSAGNLFKIVADSLPSKDELAKRVKDFIDGMLEDEQHKRTAFIRYIVEKHCQDGDYETPDFKKLNSMTRMALSVIAQWASVMHANISKKDAGEQVKFCVGREEDKGDNAYLHGPFDKLEEAAKHLSEGLIIDKLSDRDVLLDRFCKGKNGRIVSAPKDGIEFSYTYRDAENNKVSNSVVIWGEASDEKISTIKNLIAKCEQVAPKLQFIPGIVGLRDLQSSFVPEDVRKFVSDSGWNEDIDHPYHEVDDIEPIWKTRRSDLKKSVNMNVDEFIEKLRTADWSDSYRPEQAKTARPSVF